MAAPCRIGEKVRPYRSATLRLQCSPTPAGGAHVQTIEWANPEYAARCRGVSPEPQAPALPGCSCQGLTYLILTGRNADTPPSHERERQIWCIATGSAAGRAVKTAASSAATSAPQRIPIAQLAAKPVPQPFAQPKRSHSRLPSASEKVDQRMERNRILRRCISCRVTPEDGSANGGANGSANSCAKRAEMASGSAA